MREAMRGRPGWIRPRYRRCRRDAAGSSASSKCTSSRARCSTRSDMPLGVVTSINGGVRLAGGGRRRRQPCGHDADGPPPRRGRRGRRTGALPGAARGARTATRSARSASSQVPAGSINVVPGRCQFTLDMRAPPDAQRDVLVADVLAELEGSASGADCTTAPRRRMRVARRAERTRLAAALGAGRAALGLPVHRMPSGAGHDAMKLHEVMPQAMLFVRGGNCRHQPQPARIDHRRRHAAVRRGVSAPLDQLAEGSPGRSAGP